VTKRLWKVILCVVVALLVLACSADYFLAESIAIAWHLRHGFDAEMRGLRFRVPLLYDENHGSNMLQLSIDTFPGHLNKKIAFITVDFHRQTPSKLDSSDREARLARFGLKQSAVHPLRMAGREGTCIDLVPIPGAENASLPARVYSGLYIIDCSFGEDLQIHFDGSPNALPDFYELVRSAESSEGKI
jgi:hypothetical protein